MKSHLNENSLYTNQAEKDALIADKEKVVGAFVFSFLGILGLTRLAADKAALKAYKADDGKLRISSITDDNKDLSLVIKLAVEAKALPLPVANEMTKLLVLLKTKAISGYTIDESIIRGYLEKMKIETHKTDTRIWKIVKEYIDGNYGIEYLAKELYLLSKIQDFKALSGEFSELIKKANLAPDLLKLKPVHIGATKPATAPVAPVAPTATPAVPPASTATGQTPVAATTLRDKVVDFVLSNETHNDEIAQKFGSAGYVIFRDIRINYTNLFDIKGKLWKFKDTPDDAKKIRAGEKITKTTAPTVSQSVSGGTPTSSVPAVQAPPVVVEPPKPFIPKKTYNTWIEQLIQSKSIIEFRKIESAFRTSPEWEAIPNKCNKNKQVHLY